MTILTFLEKKCQRLKEVLGNKDNRIFFYFSKIAQKVSIFYIFVFVYVVKPNFNLKFLGSAKKCEDAINFGISSLKFWLNRKGPVSIAQ